MGRYLIRLIDGSNLPILDESQGDIIGMKDPKMLFARSKSQNKNVRIPWTSVLKIEEMLDEAKPPKPEGAEEKPATPPAK